MSDKSIIVSSNGGKGMIMSISNLQPVPLTENELVKLGFIRQGNTDVYFIAFQGRWHYYDIKYKKYTMGQETVQIEIESVHLLQNLVKSLTGKELTYVNLK